MYGALPFEVEIARSLAGPKQFAAMPPDEFEDTVRKLAAAKVEFPHVFQYAALTYKLQVMEKITRKPWGR